MHQRKQQFPVTGNPVREEILYKKSHLSPESMDKLYHKMVEEIRDYAILLLDIEGNILNWNQGAAAIKGYTSDEIVGKNFSIFYRQADIEIGLPQTLIKEATINGKASHEGWRVKKDGSTFWGSVVITALHDNDNTVIGFSKVTRDLTDRKLAEEQRERYTLELQHHNEMLRRSEERYHRMISEVEDYAIILIDLDGNILNWNKGAQHIKGYSENEIIGGNFRTFYLPEDQEKKLPEQLLATAIAENKAIHEGWRLRKDGSRFWGSIVITALHDDEGNVTGFSKVTRDLTQKKHFEDFILMQNKQLEEYAYVASHDLQEPLRKIMLYSGLVKENVDNRELMLSFLDKISVSTERMTRLIRAVLEYSQTRDSNALRSVVNLNKIIEDIETDFDMLLQEKGGKIVKGKLPSVMADPIQMHQLFSNLISNAIKFNQGKPIVTITSVTSEEAAQRPFLVIKVGDNGIGFNPEYTEKIFRMFHRLNGSAKGTGIGLALCKRIVENHGGSITAFSRPGQGAMFEISLPVLV